MSLGPTALGTGPASLEARPRRQRLIGRGVSCVHMCYQLVGSKRANFYPLATVQRRFHECSRIVAVPFHWRFIVPVKTRRGWCRHRAVLRHGLAGPQQTHQGVAHGLISQQCQCNPADEGQRAKRYNGDAGEHHYRRPKGWHVLLLHRFAFV